MKSALYRLSILAFLVAALSRGAFATTVMMPNDYEMIVGARAIVLARVIDVSSALNDSKTDVFTYVRLNVSRVLKGNVTTGQLVLKEPGGVAGGIEGVVFGTPDFSPKERVLLYLDTWPDGSPRVYQMFLGKFSVTTDQATGRTMVERQTGGSNVDVIGGAPSGPSTNSLPLRDYIKLVGDVLAANRGDSDEFQAKYFGAVPFLARPPEYDRKSGRGELQPQFKLFPNPARWFEPDSGQPVVFDLNPDQEPMPDTADDVRAAMKAWSSVPGCLLDVELGGTTDGCASIRANRIYFDNCDGRHAPTPICAMIIALGGFYATFQTTDVVNGRQFRKITGGFISFNPYSQCSFSNHCDVQEIATHELGHALGLYHSWQPNFGGAPTPEEQDATMYFAAHFDGRCASIRTDDINGIKFIYPASSGGLEVNNVALPDGTVGSPYSFAFTVSGASPPAVWSVAPEKGSPPSGMTLGADGTLTGVPTSPGSFSFSVQVVDSAGNAAQEPVSLTVSRAPLQIPSTMLATGVRGTQFSQQIMAIGGQPPYSWSIQSGALPDGLSLDPSTGTVAGIPTRTGSFDFTVVVTDSLAGTSPDALALLVVGPDAVPQISSVRYKAKGGKLIISGGHFNSAAGLTVDGVSVSIRTNTGTVIRAGKLALASGSHLVVVTNPHNLTAQASFIVQ